MSQIQWHVIELYKLAKVGQGQFNCQINKLVLSANSFFFAGPGYESHSKPRFERNFVNDYIRYLNKDEGDGIRNILED